MKTMRKVLASLLALVFLTALLPVSAEGLLAILTQPTDARGDLGDTAVFTVEAQGEELSYAWYYAAPGSEDFAPLGESSETLSIVITADNDGGRVRCVVSDPAGDMVTSDAASIILVPLNEALNVPGGQLGFTTNAMLEYAVYPWITGTEGDRLYARSGNGGVHSSSSTLNLSFETSEAGVLHFEYIASGGTGSNQDKCTFVLDGDTCLYTGSSGNGWMTLQVPVTAGSHKAYWQYKKDKSSHPTGDYFAVDNVWFEGESLLGIVTQPADAVAFPGEEAVFTVTAKGVDLSYAWYIAAPGSDDFVPADGTAASFGVTVSAAAAGTRVYCVVTDGGGASVTSDTAELLLPDQCGDDVYWIRNSGTNWDLTIAGTGAMWDYQQYESPLPSASTVVIREGVTSVGSWAFSYNSYLSSLSLPSTLETIGENAFQSCSRLSEVDLPAGLTGIGESAFRYCSGLTSVVLPAGIAEIGSSCFASCTNLASVTLPEDLASIGAYAFAFCGNLSGITLPAGLESIGYYAFSETGLTEITIPASVLSIGECAFSETPMTAITVEAGNPAYCSVNGVLFSADMTAMLCYPCGAPTTDYTVPSTVTSLANVLFAGCTHLENVILPEGITRIGLSMFQNCTALQSVTAPDRVIAVDSYAFYGCTGLTSFTVPAGVTDIYTCAFQGCSSLASITLPAYLHNVWSDAFKGCSALRDVYFAGTEERWGYMSVSSGNNYLRNATVHYNASVLHILTQPADYAGEAGEVAQFTVAAQGEGLSYVWYYAAPGSGSFALTGCTDATLSVVIGEANDGSRYYCVVTDQNGRSITSHTATLTLRPLNRALNAEKGQLSFTTAGDYPWTTVTEGSRLFARSGNAGVPSSVSVLSLSFTAETDGFLGFDFRACGESVNCDVCTFLLDGEELLRYDMLPPEWEHCEFAVTAGSHTAEWRYTKNSAVDQTGDCFDVDEVYLVSADNLRILTQPTDFVALPGDTAVFSVEARGRGVSYMWYYLNLSTGTTYPSGVTTPEYRVAITNDNIDYKFYCHITDENGNEINSKLAIILPPTDKCGDNLTWHITGDGILVIAGTGDMWAPDWSTGEILWQDRRDEILALDIRPGVTSISSGAFDMCSYISDVTLPASIASIGGAAFYRSGVMHINIPEGVSSIESNTFAECLDLLSVTIPVSVTEIGQNAFNMCRSLRDVYYGGDAFQWAEVSIGSGNSRLQSATVHVQAAELRILTQPTDFNGSLGDTALFTVEAAGDELSYLWYYANPGSDAFLDSGITTPTYTVMLTAANSGRRLYCVVTDAHGGSLQTDTVSMNITDTPVITLQPTDYAGPAGSTASFTVAAFGEGLSYQWYVKKPTAARFSKSSITAATYTVELTEARNGNQLYCVVTDAFGNTAQTNTVSMTVADPLVITADLTDYAGPVGSTASFTVEASGTGLTYQWYVKSRNATKFSKSSVVSATYSVTLTEANSGRQLYCVVTDAYGNTTRTDTVSMTVGEAPLALTADLTDYVGPVGSTATFTVEATGEGLSYQWYVKKPTATKFSRSSITGPTYSVELNAARNGNQVYCVVTDAHGDTVRTNTVSMSIG